MNHHVIDKICAYCDTAVEIGTEYANVNGKFACVSCFESMSPRELLEFCGFCTLTDEEDRYLEEKWDELTDIPFDEADTPSGLVIAQDWWEFPKGTDRDDIWRRFDQHSKGVDYLIYERKEG